MTDCFAIFEGGGAKGLAHVGALKAAEETGLRFVGLAGASAGAIVAALAAAGFRADDIYNPQPGTRSLFADLDWIALLGADEWRQFQSFVAEAAGIPPATGTPGLGTALRARKFFKRWAAQIGTAAARRGFFSTERFEAWLNDALLRRLGGPRRRITFDDLNAAPGTTTLKLVSVDIASQELLTYSLLDSPDMPVARAVAASISIPFFFAPTQVEGRAMVDGGLMSNFPAWLFESERASYPPFLRTYGFTLAEDDRLGQADGTLRVLLDYAGAVIRTGIFGGQSLLNQSVELFQAVPIRSGVGVLAFDLDAAGRTALYNQGRESAREFFRYNGVTDDASVTVALLTLADRLRALLGRPDAHLRANVMLPVKTDYLRVMYSCNMQSDTDDRLLLRQDQTGAGQAFGRKQTFMTDIRTIRRAGVIPGLSKYDSAMVRHDLVSLISIPIFRSDNDWTRPHDLRGVPRGVLNFDSSEDILQSFNNAAVQHFMIEASIVIGRLLRGELA
jgi:NTE family protein